MRAFVTMLTCLFLAGVAYAAEVKPIKVEPPKTAVAADGEKKAEVAANPNESLIRRIEADIKSLQQSLDQLTANMEKYEEPFAKQLAEELKLQYESRIALLKEQTEAYKAEKADEAKALEAKLRESRINETKRRALALFNDNVELRQRAQAHQDNEQYQELIKKICQANATMAELQIKLMEAEKARTELRQELQAAERMISAGHKPRAEEKKAPVKNEKTE